MKLRELREMFHFSRSAIANISGLRSNTITKIELGRQGVSTHVLTSILVNVREAVRIIFPGRTREFDKWRSEFIGIVYTVEEERRQALRARTGRDRQEL